MQRPIHRNDVRIDGVAVDDLKRLAHVNDEIAGRVGCWFWQRGRLRRLRRHNASRVIVASALPVGLLDWAYAAVGAASGLPVAPTATALAARGGAAVLIVFEPALVAPGPRSVRWAAVMVPLRYTSPLAV